MAVTVVQTEGLSPTVLARHPELAAADWQLDWRSPRRNAVCTLADLRSHLPGPFTDLAQDFLDVATATYLTDIAVPRGRNEQWVREVELVVAVRELDFWESVADQLMRLVQLLTGDNFRVAFYPRANDSDTAGSAAAAVATNPAADCVCLLSGGVDSLAGAVMLLRAGRQPHLVLHYSGNPTVRAAQDLVSRLLDSQWPDQSRFSGIHIAPDTRSPDALPYPEPDGREPSRRVRSLLYLVLGAVAAAAAGLEEIYMGENGVLTAGLPLTVARSGSLSTRSTHPQLINQFNDLCAEADWDCRVQNPFVYQTKGELIRDILRPALSPLDIQKSVSCWMAGRANRQCGGCIPCLLRRIGMLAAGLPDEAYMMDLLGDPLPHAGTDAFTNLVDLLNHAATVLAHSDEELIHQFPRLLDLTRAGVSVSEVIATLRRHATEVHQVITTHFPNSARLLEAL